MMMTWLVYYYFFISFHETTFNLVFKFFEDRDDADEFLNEKRSIEAMKRFLYTGKEQRREAKENYEEKCERNVLNKARKIWIILFIFKIKKFIIFFNT